MKQTLHKLLGAGCVILSLGSTFACTSWAAPIPLPDWAKPIEAKLPNVSPEIISEVDDLYTFWTSKQDVRNARELRDQVSPVARRMVELKEQTGQAMIWQFLREDNRNASFIMYVLSDLSDDRDLAIMLLPVIRCRMEWLKRMTNDGKIKQYAYEYGCNTEFQAIKQYIYSRGAPDDLEALERLMDEDAKHGNPTFSDRETPEQQARAIQEARERSQKHNAPYWHRFADYLIEQSLLTKEAFLTGQAAPSRGQESIAKNIPSNKPLPEITPQTHFLQPWMMWLLIGVVLACLLSLGFRKPKPK